MDDHRIVGDRYRLSSRLGRGGTAEVYFGLDTRLCRPVAVKLLRSELADEPEARALFRREARFVGGLQHPNVVAVYDAGETDDPGTGASLPYLVLEYAPGRTLQSTLAQGRALEPTRALRITRDLLDALACCHAAGVVHHDVKPANVIIALDGAVKLMDFGIAQRLTDGPTDAPAVGAVRGTAKYLAPERLRGGSGDARADLYSVGVLLYQLLVGRPPFVGDEATVLRQQLYAGPVAASELNPALGRDLDAVLRTALAKAPADRFGSAAEMRAAVQGLLDRRVASGSAVAPAGAGSAVGVVPVVVGSVGRRGLAGALGGAHRRRALVAAGVAAALVPMAGLVARNGDVGVEQVQASVSTADGASTETVRGDGRTTGSRQSDGARAGTAQPGPREFGAAAADPVLRPVDAAETVARAAAGPSAHRAAGRGVAAAAADVAAARTAEPGRSTTGPVRAEPGRSTRGPVRAEPATPPKAAPKPSQPPLGGGASAPRPVVKAPKPARPVKPTPPPKAEPPKAAEPKAPEPPRAPKPAEPPKAEKPEPPRPTERPKAEKPRPPKPQKPAKPPKAEKPEKAKPPKTQKPPKPEPPKREKADRGERGSGKSERDSDSRKRDRESERD